MVVLLCTVRGCRRPLDRQGDRLACALGHAFDVARRGYVNLLQPQDRRSAHPGDSDETIRARARLVMHGPEHAIVESIARLRPSRAATVLDVGCGDGAYLAAMVGERDPGAYGLDISVAAIDAAAKAHPGLTWVVANADRFLPFADGSFDLVTSINARLNPSEFRRVLREDGALMLVVPGAEDLIELRAAVLGEGVVRDRGARALRACEAWFTPEQRHEVRSHARLNSDEIKDVLTASYRGLRQSQQARVAALGDGVDVTLARDVFVLRPAPADSGA
jgi:23S rRNA (guanine745-N1)-methyltransferase